MKKPKFIRFALLFPVVFLFALGCGTARAGGGDSGTGLSDADRTAMAEGAQNYRRCLQKEAEAVMGDYNDVRKVADVAMKKCAPVLETLHTQLKSSKTISPELAAGFVHYSANAGVRQLLKQLMEQKAATASAAH